MTGNPPDVPALVRRALQGRYVVGPPDVMALVRAGVLEEIERGVFRKPRLPARDEVHGQPGLAGRPPLPSEESP